MEFRVNKLQDGTFQFFFQLRDDMEGILQRAPWNIEKLLLILLEGRPNQIPPYHFFEWIKCWVHVWGLLSFVVSEAIG